jgi:acyl carrier protein
MSAEIENEISQFISTEVLEDHSPVPPDQPLLTGLLDSFGLLAVLNFLEERFGVAIAHDEVVTENFSSVRALASFVDGKRVLHGQT